EAMLEFSKRPYDLKDGAGLDTVLAPLVQKDGVALVKKVGLVLLLSPDYLKCRRGLLVADKTAAVDVGSSGNGTRFVFACKCHRGSECKATHGKRHDQAHRAGDPVFHNFSSGFNESAPKGQTNRCWLEATRVRALSQ